MTTRVPWRRWTDPAPMSGLVISRCAIPKIAVNLEHCGCGGPETHAPAVPHTLCERRFCSLVFRTVFSEDRLTGVGDRLPLRPPSPD